MMLRSMDFNVSIIVGFLVSAQVNRFPQSPQSLRYRVVWKGRRRGEQVSRNLRVFISKSETSARIFICMPKFPT